MSWKRGEQDANESDDEFYETDLLGGDDVEDGSEEDDALLNDDELLADDPQPGYVTAEPADQLHYESEGNIPPDQVHDESNTPLVDEEGGEELMDDQPQDMGHEQHEQVLAEDDMGALAGEMAADAECATEDGAFSLIDTQVNDEEYREFQEKPECGTASPAPNVVRTPDGYREDLHNRNSKNSQKASFTPRGNWPQNRGPRPMRQPCYNDPRIRFRQPGYHGHPVQQQLRPSFMGYHGSIAGMRGASNFTITRSMVPMPHSRAPMVNASHIRPGQPVGIPMATRGEYYPNSRRKNSPPQPRQAYWTEYNKPAVEGSLIASNVIRPGTARLLRPRVPNAVSVRRARLLTVQHPPMPRQMIKSMSPEVPAERPPAPRLMETVTEHTESQRHTDPARPKKKGVFNVDYNHGLKNRALDIDDSQNASPAQGAFESSSQVGLFDVPGSPVHQDRKRRSVDEGNLGADNPKQPKIIAEYQTQDDYEAKLRAQAEMREQLIKAKEQKRRELAKKEAEKRTATVKPSVTVLTTSQKPEMQYGATDALPSPPNHLQTASVEHTRERDLMSRDWQGRLIAQRANPGLPTTRPPANPMIRTSIRQPMGGTQSYTDTHGHNQYGMHQPHQQGFTIPQGPRYNHPRLQANAQQPSHVPRQPFSYQHPGSQTNHLAQQSQPYQPQMQQPSQPLYQHVSYQQGQYQSQYLDAQDGSQEDENQYYEPPPRQHALDFLLESANREPEQHHSYDQEQQRVHVNPKYLNQGPPEEQATSGQSSSANQHSAPRRQVQPSGTSWQTKHQLSSQAPSHKVQHPKQYTQPNQTSQHQQVQQQQHRAASQSLQTQHQAWNAKRSVQQNHPVQRHTQAPTSHKQNAKPRLKEESVDQPLETHIDRQYGEDQRGMPQQSHIREMSRQNQMQEMQRQMQQMQASNQEKLYRQSVRQNHPTVRWKIEGETHEPRRTGAVTHTIAAKPRRQNCVKVVGLSREQSMKAIRAQAEEYGQVSKVGRLRMNTDAVVISFATADSAEQFFKRYKGSRDLGDLGQPVDITFITQKAH